MGVLLLIVLCIVGLVFGIMILTSQHPLVSAFTSVNQKRQRKTRTMKKLKPCPFCGNEYLSVSYYDGQIFSAGTFSVVCDRCGTCGPLKSEKQAAIDAWNKRS